MKTILRMRLRQWLTLGGLCIAALRIVGCEPCDDCSKKQAEYDLPAPSGTPAYLLSVDGESNVNIYSVKGEPWQECTSKACLSIFNVDREAVEKLFKSSKATGGFILLSFEEMKTEGLVNVSLISKAHAQPNCKPVGIFPRGASAKINYPTDCTLP